MELLDHGKLELIDCMGSDESIVKAARVSYSDASKHKSDTRTLIRYLMRHRHTSPFEMAEMIFCVKCPIFVARQWMRHRTGSFNEVSGRYSELPSEYFMPKVWRGQGKKNKQGSEGVAHHLETSFECVQSQIIAEECAMVEYDARLRAGVSRELARTCLPLSTYTEFVWKVDLHNLLHFLSLRLDEHAQEEIRVYAEAIRAEVMKRFPLVWDAFNDYRLSAMTLSRGEIHALRTYLLSSGAPDEADMQRYLGKSEWDDFAEKMKRLGAL